jgi:hypothetical protein
MFFARLVTVSIWGLNLESSQGGRQLPALGQLVLTKHHTPRQGESLSTSKSDSFNLSRQLCMGKDKAKIPQAQHIVKLTRWIHLHSRPDWWTPCGAHSILLANNRRRPRIRVNTIQIPSTTSEHQLHNVQTSLLKSKRGCIKISQCSVPSQIQMPITQPRIEWKPLPATNRTQLVQRGTVVKKPLETWSLFAIYIGNWNNNYFLKCFLFKNTLK